MKQLLELSLFDGSYGIDIKQAVHLTCDALFNVLNSKEDRYDHKAAYQHMGKPEDMKLFGSV